MFTTRWQATLALIPLRVFAVALRLALFSTFFLIGLRWFPWSSPGSKIYWAGWSAMVLVWLLSAPARAIIARIRFQSRARAALPDGPDASTFVAAATAIHSGNEERGLYLLENLKPRAPGPEVEKARRWLSALAAVRWIIRQRPPRPLSGFYHRYPQLHAMVFCYGRIRVPQRSELLARELAEASSSDLDSLARSYIALIDELVASLSHSHAPFGEEAEHLLTVLTGRSYMLNPREQYAEWWGRMRPVMVRGGGALLVGVRMLQREMYAPAAQLLTRLSNDGLLSDEADTIRRTAAFLTLFARPQWRMTSGDIPRYFTEGLYYLAVEMGVLRFPTADLPEVVGCCKRGKLFRDAKRRLIDDTLALWAQFGDDLAPPLTLLLKRLLENRARHVPARLSFWREQWSMRKDGFEAGLCVLMDGVVATHHKRLDKATRLFEQAAQMDPQSSVPLVNLVYVHLKAGRAAEAKALAAEIQRVFPKDGQALISLGRMFASQLDETAEAERLFYKALELTDPPTEALICLGEIKLMGGLYLESQAYFDHARQLDPTLPDPQLGLARIYMETKRYDLAIDHLQNVAKDGPEEARDLSYYLLYRAHREKGDDRVAVDYLDKVPTRFFKEPDILDDIAVHLESEHLYTKAREFAERAMILRANGDGRNDSPDAMNAF